MGHRGLNLEQSRDLCIALVCLHRCAARRWKQQAKPPQQDTAGRLLEANLVRHAVNTNACLCPLCVLYGVCRPVCAILLCVAAPNNHNREKVRVLSEYGQQQPLADADVYTMGGLALLPRRMSMQLQQDLQGLRRVLDMPRPSMTDASQEAADRWDVCIRSAMLGAAGLVRWASVERTRFVGLGFHSGHVVVFVWLCPGVPGSYCNRGQGGTRQLTTGDCPSFDQTTCSPLCVLH